MEILPDVGCAGALTLLDFSGTFSVKGCWILNVFVQVSEFVRSAWLITLPYYPNIKKDAGETMDGLI